jgi:uncharacterized tellurite resistance protein B-like protein
MAEPAPPSSADTETTFDDAGLERVVADPLRFKQQLRIGEDAFALLRAKKNLYTAWETLGAATTGAGFASSSMVARIFFSKTALATGLGLGSAATPVGWVVAAAFVAGGGYYGATRWFSDKTGAFVDTIPKYINTPIDVLGAALIDFLGSLALRVAAIDGRIDPTERECILDHFVQDWGFDATYAARALDALAPHADATRVKALAQDLAQFEAANPDCNAPAMQAELMRFLRELVAADGVLDEREELALEAIERVLGDQNKPTLFKAGEGLADISRAAGLVAADAATAVSGTARSFGNALSSKLGDVSRSLRDKAKS